MHLSSLKPSPISPKGIDTQIARALVEHVLRGQPVKRFAIRLWDGTEVAWAREREFTLVFHDAPTFVALAVSRSPSAFADAYVDERIDIEGDVDAALRLVLGLRRPAGGRLQRLTSSIAMPRPHARLRHTRARDLQDIHAHYDLSDDFFRLFLDSQMVYSCAYFARPGQALEEAQERKLDLVCRKLALRPGESLLDVGCGWGALAVWAASRYGVRVHGITLSRNQAETARARVRDAGLAEQVTIEVRHYADLPAHSFDKIASVGMIEHVGVAGYGRYFGALHRALRAGGLLLNHGITHPARTPDGMGGDFIRRHVFPGAEIPTLPETLAAMDDEGFELLDVQALRPHYALTLAEWSRRYAARREEASRLVSRHTLRTWDLYLPGCRHGFEEGLVSVHQCLAAKPAANGAWPLPLTREEMLLLA